MASDGTVGSPGPSAEQGASLNVMGSASLSGKGLVHLFLAGNLKTEVQAGEGFSSSALKSKPSGGPRSAGLVSQHSYSFIPLGNQSSLSLKVPAHYTTLLRQAFYRALSLRSLTMSHSYRFVPLGNQSLLPLKVPAQRTALLRQAF